VNLQQSAYGMAILLGLDRAPGGPKHVYGGTVPVHVVALRRKKGKAARRARRKNR